MPELETPEKWQASENRKQQAREEKHGIEEPDIPEPSNDQKPIEQCPECGGPYGLLSCIECSYSRITDSRLEAEDWQVETVQTGIRRKTGQITLNDI